MPVWRMQCYFGADTAFPRDRVMINPVFNVQGGITSAQSLCDDLAAALSTWEGGTREVVVKAYDAQGTPPVEPQGVKTINSGVYPQSFAPRELALCLSFYSDSNVKRRRGRLYVPVIFIAGPYGKYATTSQMQKAKDLAPIFENLGGVETDWSVFSKLDNTARKVTNYFVNNEWDIIRSRGIKESSRLVGTTSE